jgi:hypothetical protein
MDSYEGGKMTVAIVTTTGGQFVKAFLNEEDARKWVLKQPGKFNNYDVTEEDLADTVKRAK